MAHIRAVERKKQVLILDPREEVIFDDTLQTDIRMTNPTSHTVCFRWKSTFVSKYTFKPDIGYLMPQSSRVITVSVTPFPSLSADMKWTHLFLNSLCAPEDIEMLNLDICKRLFYYSLREELMETTLNCQFRLPAQSLLSRSLATTTAGAVHQVPPGTSASPVPDFRKKKLDDQNVNVVPPKQPKFDIPTTSCAEMEDLRERLKKAEEEISHLQAENRQLRSWSEVQRVNRVLSDQVPIFQESVSQIGTHFTMNPGVYSEELLLVS